MKPLTITVLLPDGNWKPSRPPPLAIRPPLVMSSVAFGALEPMKRLPATVVGTALLRTFQVAGANPGLSPTEKELVKTPDPLLMVALRVSKVPPLNWKLPSVLVSNSWSASISPAFSALVPRRMSSVAVAAALVTVRVPLSTANRLFVAEGLKPTNAKSARTAPPLVTSSVLPAPE